MKNTNNRATTKWPIYNYSLYTKMLIIEKYINKKVKI